MTDFGSDHPRVADGTFTEKAQTAPETTLTPASAFDMVAAAVIAKHPDAVTLRVPAVEYDNGYFFSDRFEVTLADDVVVTMEADNLDDELATLSYIESPGSHGVDFNLLPYLAGQRQPVNTIAVPNAEPENWEAELTARLTDTHPELVSVELETEEYDNGFFWAEEASGVDQDGNQVLVDLSDYADMLSDAASYDALGRHSTVSLKLR